MKSTKNNTSIVQIISLLNVNLVLLTRSGSLIKKKTIPIETNTIQLIKINK